MRWRSRAVIVAGLLLAAQTGYASLETDCFYDGGFYDSTFYAGDFYDESCSVSSSFDLTGLPVSWEPWYDASLLNEFITIKQQECDGDAVWAKWRAGTSVTPRGSANCVVQENFIRQEADGSAVWARWAPNTTIRNSALLQIDIRAALTADFVVN